MLKDSNSELYIDEETFTICIIKSCYTYSYILIRGEFSIFAAENINFTIMTEISSEKRKGAYIRETREMAEKAAKLSPESIFIGLEDYLPFLYTGRSWIHDKPFGKRGGQSYRIRPDYLCEEEKLIIEFDGLQHYTNPLNIRKDRENQTIYESFGYKVIRIPYFINLTTDVVKEMFGISTHGNLFDPSLPSMSVKWQNTPAFCCVEGIRRMAEEFKRYPQQYEVNIQQLEADNDEALSGASLLKAAMRGEL